MRRAALDRADLESILAEHYDLSGITVRPAARAFVAETFEVNHPSGRYFAKIVPVSQYSARFEASLPVLAALAKAGIPQIPQVFQTIRGDYSVAGEDSILALFSYIAGEWTIEYDFQKYVNLIAMIHGRTGDAAAKPKRETFELPFLASLNEGVRTALSLSPLDECERRLKKIVGRLAAEWEQDVARVQEWGARLRACRDIEFVITHGDGPGNILKDARDEIYLVDWDDVLLAPRERDTWFHLRDSGAQDNNAYHRDGPAFLGYYRRICPGYQVVDLALHFYVCLRYLDDLDGFISRIMEPGQALAEKEQYLALLEKDCLRWLRPWVRRIPSEV